MYDYRKLSSDERNSVVQERRLKRQPWHSPPHQEVVGRRSFLLSAACYEHLPIIGHSPERLCECEDGLLEVCRMSEATIYAWCILPNHYHLLVSTDRLKELLRLIGRLHGRTSFIWNGNDNQRGRQVWFNCFERLIRSERHFWASVNYVHHNPVHHGYVQKWQDWPWSSAAEFVAQHGREYALALWEEYPLLDYGKKWDV
jgi:putative transposase